MARSAIDCTPEDVLEEMGLLRKGDIYALKALCSKKKQGPGASPSSSSSEETSSTTKAPKTRRIALGLMLFNKSKIKFVSVRYARGGGSRTLDVPLNATKQELIEMGKDVFFAEGVAPIGKASDFTFGLANFKGEAVNKLRDSDGRE